MTPQSNFMILAPIDASREADLRALLASMNLKPGIVNPHNPVLPFGKLSRLHFARLVILNDDTLNDVTAYGLKPVSYPIYLTFLGDVDGDSADFLAEIAARYSEGLKQIFSHCQGFVAGTNLLGWMKANSVAPAAAYVNWVGRTVQQVDEEEALRQTLEKSIQQNSDSLRSRQPRDVHKTLRGFVDEERRAGRLKLSDPVPAPLGWRIRNLLNLVGVPLLLLVAAPILLLYLPVFIVLLRRRETTDPVIAPRVDAAHADLLASLEDQDVTNQFSALGSLKPGLFRLSTIAFVLWIIDYTARHIYNRGRLARVSTIQFARWVFLDGGKRVIFTSNYDGSLDSYMDDFINKVGFGLNVVFSNGLGYPRTSWLALNGAQDEQKFKNFLRRHQLPTQVWYNAHPGLTALDKRRNMLIRQGLESLTMNYSEMRDWLALF
jgi:hypothetical protein